MERDLCPVERSGIARGMGPKFPTPEVETIVAARVVHVNDNIEGAVYIGRAMPRQGLRGHILQNRFKIGHQYTRIGAVDAYLDWLVGSLHHSGPPNLREALVELRGKPLACWCRHDGEPKTDANACHGDVLVELLERYTDDELMAMTGGKS